MGTTLFAVILLWSTCFIILALATDPVSSRRAREGDYNNKEAKLEQNKAKDYFLLDHCHKTILYYYYYDNKEDYIPVKSGIKLQLDRNIEAQYVQFKCYATITAAKPGHRLMLHFNSININSKFQPYLHERLHIFDGTTRKDLTPFLGLYGNYSNDKNSPPEKHLTDYISLGTTLIVYFEGIPTYSSFDAIVTSILNPFTNGTCPQGYFLCKSSQFCIPASLQCDGYNNCGSLDTSDEEQCFYDGTGEEEYSGTFDAENIGLMVGSSVSLLILMIVIIWFSIICLKRAVMKRDLRRLMHGMAPPSAPDPNRVYISPHAAMAMLSPPPLYSENQDPEAALPSMELPPPYCPVWLEAHGAVDTERLLPQEGGHHRNAEGIADRVNAQQDGGSARDSESTPLSPSRDDGYRGMREEAPAVAFVGNVNNGLPAYTSSDDLPSYAAATTDASATAAAGDRDNREEAQNDPNEERVQLSSQGGNGQKDESANIVQSSNIGEIRKKKKVPTATLR